jgi:MoxR-like ATPase
MRDKIGHKQVDTSEMVETPENPSDMADFLNDNALDLKPPYFKMSDMKWKHAIRSALRGKNLMFTGPSGCGKTMAVMEVRKALKRPFHYMNLGSTQDPRTTLIGTREADDGTTYFKPAPFVNVIQNENSMVLLDEISRAHPEAWNILLTVLDPKQRYLQVDEAAESDKVPVADGVCFMSTANIGTQYTATRQMDRALEERFTIIEMDILEQEEEFDLLQKLFPNVEDEQLDTLATIADETRREVQATNPGLNRIISTRQTVQMAEQLQDGYSMMEAIHVTVYPNYDKEGGDQSPRSTVQKIVQKEVDEQDVDSVLFDHDDIRHSRKMNNS